MDLSRLASTISDDVIRREAAGIAPGRGMSQRSASPMRARRPYVLVNVAMTADGKIDSVDRRGARISSDADGARVQRLRAESDAVMVGGRTVLDEDPRLTVRSPGLVAERQARGATAQPLKAAVVSKLPEPAADGGAAAMRRFVAEGGGPVVVFTTERSSPVARAALEARGAEVVVSGRDRVDLAATLRRLHATGVRRLLVEGGGTLVAGLLAEGFVDELDLFIAPIIVGGASAPTPVDGPGIRGAAALVLRLVEARPDPEGGVLLRYRLPSRPDADGVGHPSDTEPEPRA